MPRFDSFDGTSLHYDVRGHGSPVLLLHGFAADSSINWVRPGIADKLVAAGKSAVLLDARGHGQSDKPHDAAAYEGDAMVRDARAILDHLGLGQADVVGYSMGAAVALRMLPIERRLRRAVLGGVGIGSARPAVGPGRDWKAIAGALRADDPDSITDRGSRAFRDFADLTKADRHALAAVASAGGRHEPVEGLDSVTIPVLVLVGAKDELARGADALAALFIRGRAEIAGGTHLAAVNDPSFQDVLVSFLSEGASAGAGVAAGRS